MESLQNITKAEPSLMTRRQSKVLESFCNYFGKSSKPVISQNQKARNEASLRYFVDAVVRSEEVQVSVAMVGSLHLQV